MRRERSYIWTFEKVRTIIVVMWYWCWCGEAALSSFKWFFLGTFPKPFFALMRKSLSNSLTCMCQSVIGRNLWSTRTSSVKFETNMKESMPACPPRKFGDLCKAYRWWYVFFSLVALRSQIKHTIQYNSKLPFNVIGQLGTFKDRSGFAINLWSYDSWQILGADILPACYVWRR